MRIDSRSLLMSDSCKLIVVLIGVVLAMPAFVNAQSPVRFGVDAGMNIANQSSSYGDYVWMEDWRVGFIVGGLADVRISEVIFFQIEPRYIQKGMKTQVGPDFLQEVDFKLAYLEVPLLLKVRFGTTDVRPFLCAGPSVGYLLSAITRAQTYNIQGVDITSEYRSVDFSLIGGGGVECRLSKTVSLIGSARYAFGIYNISPRGDSNVTSRGIEIIFGSLIDL